MAVSEKDTMIIGKRIKRFRINAKLSQSQLAEKAEIDTNNLSRIERGLITPSLDTVLKLSDALGITPNDILLESYQAPTVLLDAEMAKLIGNMSNTKRKKVIEYINFLNRQSILASNK